MSFLSGLFLAALPLAAVPVLIHLYRGRQRDVIPWGAMQFLAQAATKGRTVERLEDLLLMALRVAALVALVLALAQPMIRGAWWGSSAESEIVLLLDNSLSMARMDDGDTLWGQTKTHVQQIVDELSDNVQMHVLLTAGGGEWLTTEGILSDRAGKDRLLALIDNLEPTLGSTELLSSLQRVVHAEPESRSRFRRIVIFTDNQARSWQLDSERAWRQLETARRQTSQPTAIEVVVSQASDSPLHNLAVTEVEAARTIVRADDPIELSAEVTNVGQTASDRATLEWFVGEELVSTTTLEPLQPSESTQSTTTLRRDEPGVVAISCRVQAEDDLPLDQKSTVVIEVSNQLPILLVHDKRTDTSAKSTDLLMTAALGYVGEQAQDWHSVFRPHVVSSDQLEEVRLADYRCVVFTNLAEIPSSVRERLKSFVDAGGGLWLALGDRIDHVGFNRDWHEDGDGLSPVTIEVLTTVRDTNEPSGMIHPPSREHPATLQLANTTQLDIDEARLLEYWRLAQNSLEQDKVSVLLTSGDGSPLVVENYVGRGRVLLQAFPLGLEWSNLPQLKSYVVMIQDWLEYLTAGSTAKYNLSPGNAIVATPPAGTTFASATLISPEGGKTPLVVQELEENTTLRYSRTHLPGLYQIRFESGGETVATLPFYVSRDTKESDLQTLSAEDHTKLLALAELNFDGTETFPDELAETVAPAEPIWRVLLLILIVLLVSELLFSSWIARQRSGFPVSTS